MAGSKFRAACLETFSDAYELFTTKVNSDDLEVHRQRIKRRRRQQTKHDTCVTSNFGQDTQNGLINSQKRNRSTSMTQACSYPLTNLSKPPSNETIISTQINSRRQSKVTINVNEV